MPVGNTGIKSEHKKKVSVEHKTKAVEVNTLPLHMDMDIF